jgi:hypothetical protein
MTTEQYMRQKIAEARLVLSDLDNLLGSGIDRDERERETWRLIGQLNTLMLRASHPEAGINDVVLDDDDEDDDSPTAADYRETERHHRRWLEAQRGLK